MYGRNCEYGLVAKDACKDRIGNRRGNDAEDNSLGFEVLTVENFHRGQGASQRSTKNSAQPPGAPGQKHEPSFADIEFQCTPKPGTYSRSNLRDRAFPPGASSCCESNYRSDAFDEGNTRPNEPLLIMKGVDESICSMPFCFRGPCIDNQT